MLLPFAKRNQEVKQEDGANTAADFPLNFVLSNVPMADA